MAEDAGCGMSNSQIGNTTKTFLCISFITVHSGHYRSKLDPEDETHNS